MKRKMWLGLHWVIIVNFLVEIVYASYMVFIVLKPADGSGPLFERALSLPFEQMTTRRLYALFGPEVVQIHLGMREGHQPAKSPLQA